VVGLGSCASRLLQHSVQACNSSRHKLALPSRRAHRIRIRNARIPPVSNVLLRVPKKLRGAERTRRQDRRRSDRCESPPCSYRRNRLPDAFHHGTRNDLEQGLSSRASPNPRIEHPNSQVGNIRTIWLRPPRPRPTKFRVQAPTRLQGSRQTPDQAARSPYNYY